MRERKFSFVVTFWWVLGFMLLGCFLLAYAPRESRESDAENRMLAGFPQFSAQNVANRTFMTGLESFLSDGFWGREDVIAGTNAALALLDWRTEEDIFLLDETEAEITDLAAFAEEEPNGAHAVDDALWAEDAAWEEDGLEAENAAWEEDGLEADGEPRNEAHGGRTATVGTRRSLGRAGRGLPRHALLAAAPGSEAPLSPPIFLDESQAPPTPSVRPFDPDAAYTLRLNRVDGTDSKVYTYAAQNILTFAQTLQMYRDALGADGTVHFVNVPLSSVANRVTRQRKTFIGWESDVEEALQSVVGQGISIHNAPAVLLPHMLAGETVYYLTDHHWSALGAYYVCAEMIRSQGLPVIPYEEYDYKAYDTERDGKGNRDRLEVLYPLQPTRSFVVTQLTRERELELMAYKVRTYRAFMNNTRTPWRRVHTGFHSGRRALVVCDSFGNAFTPYLLPYYDEVFMTDPRQSYYSREEAGGSIAELMGYFQVDDVYIVLSTANSINSATGLRSLREYFEP